MTYDQEKSGLAITFVKYFISAVSLMFLTKSLIWNKITFQLSNSLNPAELLVNELTKSISRKFTNIPFTIRFINAYYKDFRSL